MRNQRYYAGLSVALLLWTLAIQPALSQRAFRPEVLGTDAARKAKPFQANNGLLPSKKSYDGPLFAISHAWPNAELPPAHNMPWQIAIGNGPITTRNAAAYAKALKDSIATNGRNLVMHYDTWDATKARWYNEPWVGSLRESIHGTYPAGEFGPGIFPNTGLRATFQTHVLTYYDARAAFTLQKFWGATAMKPILTSPNAQFAEGSVIVKAAVFASTDPVQPLGWWDAMAGAQVWELWRPNASTVANPSPLQGYVAQFDIIVKDTQSSPKTGWVFMTLVYDTSAAGDVWDRLVPLGVQWGNDPQAAGNNDVLQENWINPNAPTYSTQTLGWGGRLSGPNDGGRNDIAVNGTVIPNAPDSGCISCHSTAQWNIQDHRMPSFLLPSFSQQGPPGFQTCGANGNPDPNGLNICSPRPGSSAWMKWFHNRSGLASMDPDAFATDFDEVFSFKSLPLWWQATNPAGSIAPMALSKPSAPIRRFNQYTGAPLPDQGIMKK